MDQQPDSSRPQWPTSAGEALPCYEQQLPILQAILRALLSLCALPVTRADLRVLRRAYLVPTRVAKYPELQLFMQAIARAGRRSGGELNEERLDTPSLLVELPIVIAAPLADALAHLHPDLYEAYTLQDAAAEDVECLQALGRAFQECVYTSAGPSRRPEESGTRADDAARAHIAGPTEGSADVDVLGTGWPPEEIERAAYILARRDALDLLQRLDGDGPEGETSSRFHAP